MNGIDLFSGGGGALHGYVLAGHDMIGVDINPKVRGDCLRAGAIGFKDMDALEFVARRGGHPSIDFIHASPPCQFYSKMTNCRPSQAAKYPDLIGPTRDALIATGKPFIIENVEDARAWLKDPVTLCGFMFGLPSYRHRLFEAGGGLVLADPPSPPDDIRPLAEAACALLGFPCPDELNTKPDPVCGWPHPVPAAKAGHWEPGRFVSPSGNEYKKASEVGLGIGWMWDRAARGEAIPPAFTRWIGEQL